MLINELQHSPGAILEPVRLIITKNCDLAANAPFSSDVAVTFMFLLRLCVELETYVLYVKQSLPHAETAHPDLTA